MLLKYAQISIWVLSGYTKSGSQHGASKIGKLRCHAGMKVCVARNGFGLFESSDHTANYSTTTGLKILRCVLILLSLEYVYHKNFEIKRIQNA